MKIVLLTCLLFAAPCAAQDRFATTVFLGGATFDNATTWHNLSGGYTEGNPMYAFVKDQPKGVLISLAITDAATLWLAHHYAQTHPKIVKAMLFGLGGVRTYQGVRNIAIWHPAVPQFIPAH